MKYDFMFKYYTKDIFEHLLTTKQEQLYYLFNI